MSDSTEPEPGTTHKINVHEGSSTEDVIVGGSPILRRKYLILEGRTLIKRGRKWHEGEIIDLDPLNGNAFIETGDVEEVKGADPVFVNFEADDNETKETGQ